MTHWRMIERDIRDQLGEGVLWSARDNAVYWVDIIGAALNRLSLADGRVERWAMPDMLGWVVERRDGELIGGLKGGCAHISLDPFHVEIFHEPELHLPGNRMNDGNADRHGAIWFGTMDMEGEGRRGTIYRLTADEGCIAMDNDYYVPNGPAFSDCGRWLYAADTGIGDIYRYALTDEGVGHKTLFARFSVEEEGYPDGMTVDSEGFLWVAHWGGGRITRFAPDGQRDRTLMMPAKQVTKIAFAGDGLDRMFVTTASVESGQSLYDGALYEVDCGCTGLLPGQYAG